VALTLHVVLTTTELDDGDLIVTTLRNDFSRYLGAFDDRGADGDVITVANQQHAVESQRFASGQLQFLDLEEFAFGDFVLLATSNNYCVHGKSPLILLTQRFIGITVGWHGCSGPDGHPCNCVRQGNTQGEVQGARLYASHWNCASAACHRLDSPHPAP